MKTFTQKKTDAKAVLNSMRLNEYIFNGSEKYNTLLDFILHHPEFDKKVNGGLRCFTKVAHPEWGAKNASLAILDNSDNVVTISLNFQKSNNKDNNILKALRSAIHPEIKLKKDQFIDNVTKCEISNEVIGSYDNLHIDHHNLDFKDIVDLFLKSEEIILTDIKIEKIGTSYHLPNGYLKDEFIKIHNANTTLRFTHKHYNLRKK